jgi:hypothetical protein
MKKLTTLLLTIAALLAFTACGDFTSIKDSSNVTTTTTTTIQDANTTERGEIVDSSNTLEVPIFAGSSQGQLVVQCEEDIVYYIMAYDSLNADTIPSVTVDNGDLTVDEVLIHEGEVFYTSGHIERTNTVAVTGHVFSGGETLPATWVATCI